ncbi:conserved exported protein of unknown function [Nitrospira moscoviensis]|uniref:TPM domain-containing protein n=1 Tax=Nitrospira moscoviensis TaxID=42253 RepID=A0A0K2GJ90_NITMO|nr:conserved exported protein of unknown function [Nitrospira moscoviensis]
MSGLAFFLLTLALTSTSASLVSALDVPPLTGRIVDLAQVLPGDLAAKLTQELEAHEAKTGNQVAVLVLPSLEGEPLEPFSHRVATTWALGKKGTDNGVLLLVALRERKVRIEVGYGLEGTLTDLRSARIIRNEIVPRFRAGDLPGGIAAGVRAILGTIEGAAPEGSASTRPATDETPAVQYLLIGIVVGTLAGLILSQGLQRTRALLGSVLAFLIAQFGSILLGVVAAAATAFLLLLMLHAGRGGRGRHIGWTPDVGWSGGGWSGGFSGGGGDFGGGGASGDW